MSSVIADTILRGANLLRKAGVPEARREAGSLLMHVLDRDRTYIVAHADAEISEEHIRQYNYLLGQRATGKPLQYLTGKQEFFGLEFLVNDNVLIPRPETELLVEIVLKLVSPSEPRFLCDVGTGSGCIAIALLKHLPLARAIALDISSAALSVAEANATRLGVSDRIQFVASDCFANLDPADLSFNVIVSNPPYVSDRAIQGLQREVRDFEPRVALTAGADGLNVVKRLVNESLAFLKSGGLLVFEIGFDQQDSVRELIDLNQWELLDIHDDLQGIPRTVVLRKY